MDKKAETKEEKFRRVAEKRVNKIISFIEALGRCSATSIYSYNNKQITKIFDSLQAALDDAHSRFLYPTNNGKNKFSLSGNENKDKTESLKQEISLCLPDGSIIFAVAFNDENFPAINIYLKNTDEPEKDIIAFAEYNPERENKKHLFTGVYQSDSDETAAYLPYEKE